MNEAETRAEHIDPALKAAGWGVVEGSRILCEYRNSIAETVADLGKPDEISKVFAGFQKYRYGAVT
jgi:hypothetical protein